MRSHSLSSLLIEPPSSACSNAAAYDHTGERYTLYADGNADQDGAPRRQYAHADTIVWNAIRREIDALHRSGVKTLRVLDAGCGPGVWLKRIAAYADALDCGLEAVGFDISSGQLRLARDLLNNAPKDHPDLTRNISLLVYDLEAPLPWDTGAFHIVLCNFVVLNHVSRNAFPIAVEELCRVASHRVIATLRAVASPPTSCITGPDEIADFHQDCAKGEFHITLKDGSEHHLTLNLYSAAAVKSEFAKHADALDVRAIDLFFNRFAPDAKWTASEVGTLPGRDDVMRGLGKLEEHFCRKSGWIDHGTHVLVVAQPKASRAST